MLTLDVLSCVSFSAMQQLNVLLLITIAMRCCEFFPMVIENMRLKNAAPEHKHATINVEN